MSSPKFLPCDSERSCGRYRTVRGRTCDILPEMLLLPEPIRAQLGALCRPILPEGPHGVGAPSGPRRLGGPDGCLPTSWAPSMRPLHGRSADNETTLDAAPRPGYRPEACATMVRLSARSDRATPCSRQRAHTIGTAAGPAQCGRRPSMARQRGRRSLQGIALTGRKCPPGHGGPVMNHAPRGREQA